MRALISVLVLLLAFAAPAAAQESGCGTDIWAEPEKKPKPKADGPREVFPKWVVDLAEPLAEPGGRVIAQLKSRKGYLARNAEAKAEVRAHLRPLDILVVRSRHRASSRLIPGYLGHSALYLGTERELKAAGVWNDPNLIPHQQKVRDGAVMIEADHKGVHLSRYDVVLDTDAVAIFRPGLTKAARAKSLRAFFGHIGTKYDFVFDSDDDSRLFCAELIEHAMPQVRIPRRTMYGRQVLLPVDIANAGLSGRASLSFVYYMRATKDGAAAASRRALAKDIADGW